MNKYLIWSGVAFGAIFFSYAALSALVNQGLSIAGALVMLAIVVGGGLALLMAVRE
ncbi:MAG: hypothetical protein AB2814_01475 [Candidatus Sedimenticola endophacoides]